MKNLNEGVSYDFKRRKIRYCPDNEDYLITGTTDFIPQPIYGRFKGKKLISLFQRIQYGPFGKDKADANPVIYALKGEQNWKFASKADFFELFKCFLRIVKELQETYDTVIVVPSSNKLSTEAMRFIAKQVKAKNKISGLIEKAGKIDVLANSVDWDKMEQDGYSNEDMDRFESYFKRMPNNSFRFHDIPLKERKYIKNIFYFPEDRVIESAPLFNGKKVLVLDDTIATGKSLNDTCATIIDTFDVKSITVMTIFSKVK